MTGQREGQKTLKELFQATLGEGSFSHPVRLSGRGLASNHSLDLQAQCCGGQGGAQFSGLENGSVTVGLENTEK